MTTETIATNHVTALADLLSAGCRAPFLSSAFYTVALHEFAEQRPALAASIAAMAERARNEWRSGRARTVRENFQYARVTFPTNVDGYPSGPELCRWHLMPDVLAYLDAHAAEIGDDWEAQVRAELKAREEAHTAAEAAKAAAALEAAIAAVPHAAVRAIARMVRDRQHAAAARWTAVPPKVSEYWADAPKRATSPAGGRSAYKPAPGCTARLHCRDAYYIARSSDAYADYSLTAIPVTIEAGADLSVCRQNLGAFARALNTTNGYAGFGSSYSAELIDTGDGWVALFDSRSSLGD